METMNNKDIEIINKLKNDKKWAKSTLSSYNDTIKIYCSFNKMTLHELLKEAETDEKEGKRWKERNLLRRLLDFRSFLVENYRGDSIINHFKRIKAIYNHSLIEIHKIPPINKNSIEWYRQISYNDLLKKENLRDGIEISDPGMAALIFFMSSSGCARAETLSFTIRDFIQATYKHGYHQIPYDIEGKPEIELNNINLFIDILSNLDDVVPTFNIHREKTNKYYSTFCSPEAVKAIINHLITRPDKDKLTYDSYLFKSHHRYFTEKFNKINKTLKLGKIGKYNAFSSHILRKFHASNLLRKGNGGHKLSEEQIDALQGRGKVDSRKSYMYEDWEALREEYIRCLPNITLYDEDSLVKDSKKYKTIEKRLNERTQSLLDLENDVKNLEKEKDSLKQENEEFKNDINDIKEAMSPEAMKFLKSLKK